VIRILKSRLPFDWKRQKIGHGGTLDSLASGVLLILFGEASKAFDYLLLSKKEYRALIQFGAVSDTDDADGSIIETYDREIDRKDIETALPKFRGLIMQVPPFYSSLHTNGRRNYKLARDNILLIKEPRKVEISEITIEDYDSIKRRLSVLVVCSSGTYIRSLARDLGRELSCGGYILELQRLSSSGIKITDCVSPEQVDISNIERIILPLNAALQLPSLNLNRQRDYILSGRRLSGEVFENPCDKDGFYKIIREGAVLAIVEKKGPNFNYLRVFND
jgi:tRNA pseudouridine55 synthase